MQMTHQDWPLRLRCADHYITAQVVLDTVAVQLHSGPPDEEHYMVPAGTRSLHLFHEDGEVVRLQAEVGGPASAGQQLVPLLRRYPRPSVAACGVPPGWSSASQSDDVKEAQAAAIVEAPAEVRPKCSCEWLVVIRDGCQCGGC